MQAPAENVGVCSSYLSIRILTKKTTDGLICMAQEKKLPMSLVLYLRCEDESLCGMIHNLSLDIWLYIDDLSYLLIYLDSLFKGDEAETFPYGVVQIPKAFVTAPTRNVTELVLYVTGCVHHDVQGELSCTDDDFQHTASFDSSLELLRSIHQRVLK